MESVLDTLPDLLGSSEAPSSPTLSLAGPAGNLEGTKGFEGGSAGESWCPKPSPLDDSATGMEE